MEEEKSEIKAPPNKQLIMQNILQTYISSKAQGGTYKDKILKLIKRETEKI